jgi:hypothetical protein
MPFYTASKSTFEVGGVEFPRITWYKDPNMRWLYITLMFAVLTSATNGYDGSMSTFNVPLFFCVLSVDRKFRGTSSGHRIKSPAFELSIK